MAAPKNHYTTIGVAENASADDIKKAYRKLAKKYHPDATGGDKSKEAKFKEITEAYEVLSDSKKRGEYDAMRRNPFAGGAGPGRGYGGAGAPHVDMSGGIDLDELFAQFGGGPGGRRGGGRSARPDAGGGFADIFGNMFGGQQTRPGADRGPVKGADVQARLEVELPDAALGSEKTISVDGHRSLKVKIPAGITSGKSIRLGGQGQPSPRGGPAGDLIVEISERPHPRFRRRADAPQDIEVDIPVPLDVAILGGKADVPTLEGTTLSLTIPPNTSSGKKLRLRGKGAVIGAGGAKDQKGDRGDLYANVAIELPSILTPAAKEALDRFAELLRKK